MLRLRCFKLVSGELQSKLFVQLLLTISYAPSLLSGAYCSVNSISVV